MNSRAYDILKNADKNQCLITKETLKTHLSDYFILDIRQEEENHEFYIEGALKCHWYNVHTLIDKTILPKDKKIAVICYTGQSSMHVAVLLNVLGYDAVSLLDGMSQWT